MNLSAVEVVEFVIENFGDFFSCIACWFRELDREVSVVSPPIAAESLLE